MPIYEYYCQKCNHRFEDLRPMSEADSPTVCPHCGAEGAERVPSLFSSCSIGESGSGCAPSSFS